MLSSIRDFFSEANFMPHGHCYLWKPVLVWTHVISDMLIGLAYVSISFSLYALIKKIKLPFSAMVLSFGVFIGACGATHFMEVWNIWNSAYWLGGGVKVLTAIASVATGIWLIQLKPKIIQFAEAAKLAEEQRVSLELKTIELTRTNALLAEQQKLLAHSAKMSALGEMAGGIAHEINSPLGIITVHANQLERFLKRDLLTPEMIQTEAQLISKTAKRIGEIIQGLRAFAREAESDPFEFASVATLIQEALVLCQTRLKSHGIEVEKSEVPDDLSVECRSVQISQVILNLLNNAYDAVVDLPERWIKIEIEDQGENVMISVMDSGCGIDPALHDKVMQPFFTTKEVGKGTGLGLSISKGIIEAHRGSLILDTASPNTRLVITLPKKQPEGKLK